MRKFKNYIICIAFLFGSQVCAQSGSDILKLMHQRYFQCPCKSYTFSQKNTHYKNDTMVGHSVWFESIEFPDKFRIDFGEKSEENFVVFKNDSAFNYKKGIVVKMRADSNSLLLLLGGMYYRNFEDAQGRVKNAGYNLNELSIQKWNNEEVYVIGAKEGIISANQIWISKKTLRIERIIEKMNQTDWMDMRFEAHQAWCKGFIETKVSFRRNGRLEQLEEYYDIKETPALTK